MSDCQPRGCLAVIASTVLLLLLRRGHERLDDLDLNRQTIARIDSRLLSTAVVVNLLREADPAVFASPEVPTFEPHAWWRLGATALEPRLLAERAASMETLLQALVNVLNCSILRQAGPSPFLALLTGCSPASSPRSVGVRMMELVSPQNCGRASALTAPAFAAPERPKGGHDDSAGGTTPDPQPEDIAMDTVHEGDTPTWAMEADAAVGQLRDDDRPVPVRMPIVPPSPIHAADATEPAAVADLWISADPAPSDVGGVEEGAEEPRAPQPVECPHVELSDVGQLLAATAAAGDRPSPNRPSQAEIERLLAEGRAQRGMNQRDDGDRDDPLDRGGMRGGDLRQRGRRGGGSDPGGRGGRRGERRGRSWLGACPGWLVGLVLVLVIIRAGYLFSKLSPSKIAQRIAEEKARNSIDKPIQGPHGLMYPAHVIEAQRAKEAAATAAATEADEDAELDELGSKSKAGDPEPQKPGADSTPTAVPDLPPEPSATMQSPSPAPKQSHTARALGPPWSEEAKPGEAPSARQASAGSHARAEAVARAAVPADAASKNAADARRLASHHVQASALLSVRASRLDTLSTAEVELSERTSALETARRELHEATEACRRASSATLASKREAAVEEQAAVSARWDDARQAVATTALAVETEQVAAAEAAAALSAAKEQSQTTPLASPPSAADRRQLQQNVKTAKQRAKAAKAAVSAAEASARRAARTLRHEERCLDKTLRKHARDEAAVLKAGERTVAKAERLGGKRVRAAEVHVQKAETNVAVAVVAVAEVEKRQAELQAALGASDGPP